MKIRTEYVTNDKGVGKIVAKGGGKQRTVNYNHAATPAANHGHAAGALAVAHGKEYGGVTITLSLDHGKAEFEV